MMARARRSGCCGSLILPVPTCTIWMCPTPTTTVSVALRSCWTKCRQLVRDCWCRCVPPRRREHFGATSWVASVSLPVGVTNPRRVGGGDINEAWHVRLNGEDAFVKTRADAGEGEYALEAAGLEWLAAPGALRVPQVIEVAEDYLALEWVPPGRLSAEGAEELGRGLARIHAAGSPNFGD